MLFHLYHHDDLDGIASGAVMLEFLKSKGDDIVQLHPLSYIPELTRERWMDMDIKHPSIIVDFQFHPKADWWIDHHDSAFNFAGPEYERNYKDDKQHRWDPDAKSACGVAMRFLKKEHCFEPTDVVSALVEFVDMEDSATYPELEDMLETKTPYKQLMLLLEDHSISKDDNEYFEIRDFLLRNLASRKPEDILKGMPYKDRIEELKRKRERGVNEIKQRAVEMGNVVYVDASDLKYIGERVAAFAKFPDLPYMVIVYGSGDAYKIRFLWNNWCKGKSKPMLNLGEYAKANGGGGHKGVGGINVKNKDKALKIANKVLEWINSNS